MPRASEQDGYAAAYGEEDKLARYPAVPAAALEAVQPFAVETFGRLGSLASALLRECRGRIMERIGASNFWLGHALQARWLAQINVALQNGLFDSVCACAGTVGVPVAARPHDGILVAARAGFTTLTG